MYKPSKVNIQKIQFDADSTIKRMYYKKNLDALRKNFPPYCLRGFFLILKELNSGKTAKILKKILIFVICRIRSMLFLHVVRTQISQFS